MYGSFKGLDDEDDETNSSWNVCQNLTDAQEFLGNPWRSRQEAKVGPPAAQWPFFCHEMEHLIIMTSHSSGLPFSIHTFHPH